MGQLRSAVRALAGTNLGPEAVLRHLDTFVEDVEAARYAALIYAEVDPATGEVVLVGALLDGGDSEDDICVLTFRRT